MNRDALRMLLTVLLAAAAAVVQIRLEAAPLSDAEEQAIRMVIMVQLQAFAQDDAEGAFATATPGVREAMGSPLGFLAVVRSVYPMVYRPSSAIFHKPVEDGGTAQQLLQITDDDEKSWLALFVLERQDDATWRIAGCIVAENHWLTV